MRSIRILKIVILLWGLICHCPVAADAQIESVSLGIQGNVKLGAWVPARILYQGEISDQVAVQVTLPDTDGIATTFVDRQPYFRDLGEFTLIETPVKLGRAKGLIRVELMEGLDSDSPSSISSAEFRLGEICTVLDALVELYVSVGRSIEIKGGAVIGARNEYAPAAAVSLTAEELQQDGLLANNWKSLESINGLIVEAASFVEKPLPYSVQSALVEWVKNGGRLAITGGQKLQEFFERNPELQELLVGEVLGSRRLSSTSAIERSVKGAAESVSGQRDRPFFAILRNVPGEVLIREAEDPVLIRRTVGFGQFILMTVNLAEKPLVDWSDRKSLVGLIISELDTRSDDRGGQELRETRFGFEDFSGQLRSALDDFSGVTPVNFTVVAAIAILFIGLIGPVDYFLLKRFSSRMELTWVSFSLIVVLTCGLIYWIFVSTKSDQILCRQVEVVDIDTQSRNARGSLWTHVYSPESNRYEIQWETSTGFRPRGKFGSWFGFPSDALGGMNSPSAGANQNSNYQVDTQSGKLKDVPINVASTKGLQLDWQGVAEIDDVKPLRLVRNSLNGRLNNPLNVELENVYVAYDRLIYQFKGKLGPGDSFDVDGDTRQRSFSDYLNRRKVRDLGTEATPWSISDTDLRRITEMMMFYESSGGRGYLNLFQRYFHQIDFSHLSREDYAILVGRSRQPANRLMINGQEMDSEYEEVWTYYRILVPIQDSSSGLP